MTWTPFIDASHIYTLPKAASAMVQAVPVLDTLSALVQKHLVLLPEEADAVALWVIHTHTLDCFYVSPRLSITSTQPRCGKTTLMTLLSAVVCKPIPTSNLTAATMFRIIETTRPTLLVDEADTFLASSEVMRGVINAGHCRTTATVLRINRSYNVWGAMAIAAIGTLPETIEDRSIRVRLRRKTAATAVERLRLDQIHLLEPLRKQCAQWAKDNKPALQGMQDPPVPVELHDRAADNWRVLLSIADTAGGTWPARARAAALRTST